jgi:hypothetical protein
VSRAIARLADARLRRLERRVDALEARLEQATDVLTRLVRIVAVLHRRYGGASPERRVERLTRAVTRGRTADLRRLSCSNAAWRRSSVVCPDGARPQ